MKSRSKARAAHDAELGKPQRFPLTEDGEQTRQLTKLVENGPGEEVGWHYEHRSKVSGDHLRAARYRDWKNGRPL